MEMVPLWLKSCTSWLVGSDFHDLQSFRPSTVVASHWKANQLDEDHGKQDKFCKAKQVSYGLIPHWFIALYL